MSLIQISLDQQLLTYRLENTELARCWLEMMRSQSSPVWSTVEDLAVCEAYRSQQQLQAVWDQLDQVSAALGLESRDLNSLHLSFQRNQRPTVVHQDQLWSELNRLIHLLEHLESRNIWAVMKFRLRLNRHQGLDIPDCLRPYWQHEMVSGDLCLGYETVGKTIWHCYIDDDPEPLRQQLLSPQQRIGSELLIKFGGSARQHTEEQQLQRLSQWLSRHQLEDCVDHLSPEHRYSGQPLLARLIDPCPESLVYEITNHTVIRDFRILYID